MDQRRFLLFLSLSLLIWIGWMNFVMPKFFPQPPKPAKNPVANAAARRDADVDPPADALRVANPVVAAEAPLPAGIPNHPPQVVTLGSLNLESEFFMQVELTSLGAAVKTIELNDYPEFRNRERQLKIVDAVPTASTELVLFTDVPDGEQAQKWRKALESLGLSLSFRRALPNDRPRIIESQTGSARTITAMGLLDDSGKLAFSDETFEIGDLARFGQWVRQLRGPHEDYLTFETRIPELDRQLPAGGNLALNWEVIPDSVTPRSAAFRIVSPDGALEVVKRYELKKLPENPEANQPRHPLFEGYNLYLSIELRNRTNNAVALDYSLQGPVGLPLEDAENSSKWRDLRMAFYDKQGQIERQQLTASEVFDKDVAVKLETWTAPIKYIGIDVKYFAGLVEPLGDQVKSPTVVGSRAQLVRPDKDKKFSDISVVLDAKAQFPEGENSVKHEYRLFAGPKRQELLEGMNAEEIVDFGYVTPIAKGMLWLLNSFHALGANYGIAIILLTVVVRLCMMPVSLHQAHNMQRMKDLQPKIKELQQKHKDQKEELARAQMELFRKHNYNPLSGCLPLFLQLPIFIGLYTALSGAVDLRMAKFLWIDNLASPDALFALGFTVPWFAWTDFNLLPIISTALMFFQQKMMMPPPADEEQAMQQKMMNYMMIFMGAMFYRVPAGLCLYFISSSVWGMVERWIINKFGKKSNPGAAAETAAPVPPSGDSSSGPGSRFGDMWSKLQQAVDKDTSITRPATNGHADRGGKKKKKR